MNVSLPWELAYWCRRQVFGSTKKERFLHWDLSDSETGNTERSAVKCRQSIWWRGGTAYRWNWKKTKQKTNMHIWVRWSDTIFLPEKLNFINTHYYWATIYQENIWACRMSRDRKSSHTWIRFWIIWHHVFHMNGCILSNPIKGWNGSHVFLMWEGNMTYPRHPVGLEFDAWCRVPFCSNDSSVARIQW